MTDRDTVPLLVKNAVSARDFRGGGVEALGAKLADGENGDPGEGREKKDGVAAATESERKPNCAAGRQKNEVERSNGVKTQKAFEDGAHKDRAREYIIRRIPGKTKVG